VLFNWAFTSNIKPAMQQHQAEPGAGPEKAVEQPSHSATAFIASFLGWTLDAFDFFVLVFVIPAVSKEFHRPISDIAFTITLTLIMRPVGALLFGWMADVYGRRLPLLIDVVFYSAIEVLSGLAPTYGWFLFLRGLYGIGMGGEWGVGASLAMEAVSSKRRGLMSGLLQEGYAFGYLLAAAAFFFIFPRFGWRALFYAGGLPALLTLFIRAKVPESKAWEKRRPNASQIVEAVRGNLGGFLYMIALMTMMNLISHGTQDMYPTFLERQRNFDPHLVASMAIIYNLGAIGGGLFFGEFSDRMGRRRAMITAVLLAVLVLPLWIYARSLWTLALGAFLMQAMVQGAWGVIPAHLVELSPPAVRGLFPGLAYQIGVLLAANAAYVESLMAVRMGYANALAVVAFTVLTLGAVVIALGRERAGIDLHA
jgi:SHS family lactate transporter-like MFS transporter